MAGTTHYSYYFKSYSGTEWIVLIKDSTYVGVTETALIPDNNGFNISWEGASDVTYQPIISSTFTAGVYRNANSLALLNAIITGVENQFYVIVYKSGIRQWLGYILQDSLTKPDAANLTDKIMFTATDGFGMLKDIPYTGFDIDNLTKIAMVDWLKSIMQKMPANEISGDYTYTIASDWYDDSMSTAVTFDSFSQILINESVFISVDEYGVATGISYYDMLTAVLTSFNLQISQWNGVYLLIQQNSYALTTIKYWSYRIAGTSTRGDLSLQMAAPTRFAGGTFGFILPVKECSTEYDYRHTIFDNNLLPDISHEGIEYSLGYFLTDTVFSVDGNMNTTINMSVAGEDFISIAHRITIKCGSYYLKYVVGILGPYYEWTLTASYFDITVDYPVFNGAGTSSVLLENPISLYIPSTPVDGAVTFQFDLSSVGSTNAITYSDDNSVLVVKTIATAANPAMEGSQLHKATVSNSAKAILELDNSILGDGPYMYSAGSLFVDIVSPTQSSLWSILADYGTANKWSLNTLRCMEMLALRRNTVNTFRSSWNGIPDIHKAIVFDSKTWVWTSMSFDCNAEEYSGSLIAIVLDRTGLTPATPIFKTDKTGGSTIGPSTGTGTGASTFIQLTDVPSSYTGQGRKLVAVKSDVSGLEFISAGAGTGDMLAATYDPIIAGKKVYHGVETFANLAFSDISKQLSLTAITYWYKGTKYTTAASVTCDLDLTADRDNSANTLTANKLYFFYFKDATGKLYWSDSPWSWRENVFVATVFWNGTNGACQLECHSHDRDLEFHEWAHDTIGCRYESGFDLVAPTTANDASLDIGSGTLHDEDQAILKAAGTTMRGWYLTSATVPTFANYSLPYLGTSGQPQFLDTTDYQLNNVGASDYACFWVYGSLDISRTFYVVPTHGTATFNTLNLARANTAPEVVGMNSEMKLLYKFIYKGDGQFQELVDYRLSSPLPGGGVNTVSAANVSFAPSGDVSATNVQDAINELDTEKLTQQQIEGLI